MFVDVILPLAINPLTYALPPNEEVHIGCRVVVQLGQRKAYAGVVCNVHTHKPEGYGVKEILSVVDEAPIVTPTQLKFWQWMAEYYMCTLGEVMIAALPSGLRMESEMRLSFVQPPSDYSELSETEKALLLHLESKDKQTVEELAKAIEKKNIFKPVQNLIEKGLIAADEQLKLRYKPKVEPYIRLGVGFASEGAINELLQSLRGRAKKQEALLLRYLSMVDVLDLSSLPMVSRADLLKGNTDLQSALKACISKGIFQQVQVEVSRLPSLSSQQSPLAELSMQQAQALNAAKLLLDEKDVVLLHGVTSSGKTELYLHLIEEQLRQGKQVLYLLPEIALTVQIISRLRKIFGDRVGVFHSKYSNAERVEVYQSLGVKYDIILGARSAIFLPFTKLGLVIVDEEHDSSYKQQDPAPRYNARDAAIVLATHQGAKTVLGTATPAIESYYNAQTGKYGLVKLAERFGNTPLPVVETVNMLLARKKKQVVGHLSQQLLDEAAECIENNEQVMLFQNRRGFAPFLQCNSCGHIPSCQYCNVSLTYHKQSNQLRCHYCGFSLPMPNGCAGCGSTDLDAKGFGTEKVEEELSYILPNATIRRLDLDAVRIKNAYEETIASFESGATNVLVGTQMITKGLDFGNVSLVGILNADNMLNFPDFRSHERSYQLMMQVCGRAGRRAKQGKAIIQTTTPSHPIIRYVVKGDYEGMYYSQLEERKTFYYPPFYRLVSLTLKHRDLPTLNAAAAELATIMRLKFGHRVLGPQPPLINRIQSKYISLILLKLERNKSVKESKVVLQKCIAALLATPKYKSVTISPDVDP